MTLIIEGGWIEDGVLRTSSLWAPGTDVRDQLWRIIARLRDISSFSHLERYGHPFGFRLEDLVTLKIRLRDDADASEVGRLLRRVVSPACAITFETSSLLPAEASLAVEGTFQAPNGVRARNQVRRDADSGRIRVEAFELHVVEHCNLSCAHCCNMSPYLDAHLMTVEEVDAQCRQMAKHLHADVFKIMGGEPLLHPNITEILHAIRASGIGDIVRLFTNGLLLHRMPDAFWAALDQLTISDYSSAPVKPAHLADVEEKARNFDVVLNVKRVDRFSQVMSPNRESDPAKVQATYDSCWLRDRCLIVRGGAFFKCTRAAYFREFQERIEVTAPETDPAAVVATDGVPIDAPDFGERLLAHLNATEPMGACRYCLGSSGPMVPHTQLSRIDVRRGRL